MSAIEAPASAAGPDRPQMLGHPTGLFTLFFAEMWERFSYYGMRALLVFYMTKGFLGYGDKKAYAVYGAYTALVYATPFIGGMLADRLLGTRRAVLLGGLLMAAGHLLMTVQNDVGFYGALGLLIVGNGFFKPNISTTVGALYAKNARNKDAGFTIFYMGINLGAALAPLICGYVGETYGWHYGFGLATIGMLIGVAVFVAPTILTQILIVCGALGAAAGMVYFQRNDVLLLMVYAPVGLVLLIAGVIAAAGVGRGGIPDDVGRPPKGKEGMGPYLMVCAGSLAIVPLMSLMVYKSDVASVVLSVFGAIALIVILFEAFRGTKIERERLFVIVILMFFSMLFWAFFEQAGSSVNNFTDRNVARVKEQSGSRIIQKADVGQSLSFTPTQAQLGYEFAAADSPIYAGSAATITEVKVADGAAVKPTDVVLVVQPPAEAEGGPLPQTKTLTLKDLHPSLLEGTITWKKKVGDPLDDPKVEHDALAAYTGRRTLTLDQLDDLRAEHKKAMEAAAAKSATPAPEKPGEADPKVTWTIQESHIGMLIGGKEIPASIFQAVNPVCIMIFGLIFSALWGFLGRRNMEPNTAVKFGLGLLQLGLGFGVFWWAAQSADPRGMTAMSLLIIGYALHTTGELCLSPVGLSMVTRLSPVRIVSMVMGGWFLATAFSNLLAAIIAGFTGLGHGDEGGGGIPAPLESVHVYGDVFKQIAIAGCVSALLVLILSPLLSKWMHPEADAGGGESRGGH